MRHVITLSTIPPRFSDIAPTLASLVRQQSRPEALELYIPKAYRRFPEWGGALPEVPEGVKILRVEQDLGPATKILPAARAYRGQDVELIFCDDDHYYAPDWSQRLLKVRKAHANAAVCVSATTVARMGRDWKSDATPRAVVAPHRQEQLGFHLNRLVDTVLKRNVGATKFEARFRKLDKSGYADIAEGNAGVVIRPEFLDDKVFDIPAVLWAVDDVWLSGHLARRKIAIWADKRANRVQTIMQISRNEPLYRSVIEGADRATANLACVDYMRATYGIWGGDATKSR
ncbi:glycosyltransferase family 2 protein [Tabrizicola piscis]|uniref:Glycosyltransferase family 2 protein n=1 Tax=Tabrizicola piscis TaxID=2494374 RepID=A0A3S8U4X1_9RHOB|nr:glycosyltransferase family A protein [Tabrizicola piscis]AZL58605.1 glycosyltransferase family 2 protein [Tabrizicola piscis]